MTWLLLPLLVFAQVEDSFPPVSQPRPVPGRYIQACAQRFQREHIFSGGPFASPETEGSVTSFETNFSDKFCREPDLRMVIEGTYSVRPLAGAAYSGLDFTFSSLRLIPLQDWVVAAYNERKLCGKQDWALGTPNEITGLHCDFFGSGSSVAVPSRGHQRFGIFRQEGSRLWMGQMTPAQDSSSRERRPTTLQKEAFHKVD
jgi:hypothetical protein